MRDRRAVELRIGGEPRLIAAEDAGRYRDGLGAQPPPGLPDVFLEPVDDPLGTLLGRWARTHGPFLTAEPAARFGLPVGVVEALLAARADRGVLLRGEFRPEGREREWCDPEVLRSLRQRSLAALPREVEPVEAPVLARFLPEWQGVGSEARGIDRLVEVVRQLQGVPIPASVLERDVLSARVAGWSPRLLDELAAAGEVAWVGAGPLGRDDGKVLLFLRGQAAALRPVGAGRGRGAVGAGARPHPGGAGPAGGVLLPGAGRRQRQGVARRPLGPGVGGRGHQRLVRRPAGVRRRGVGRRAGPARRAPTSGPGRGR